jgi:hypothetical protein
MATIDDALAALCVFREILTQAESEALDRDGCVMLRGLIAADRIAPLRERFERAVRPHDEWPYPRDAGMRYAMLDKDEAFREVCLSPRALAGTHRLFGRRFFLASFEGREPCAGGGGQNWHRDCLAPPGPTQDVAMLAFLDPFGPANGATRLIPGSHLGDEPLPTEDPREIVIAGEAGDALLFDARLIHSGTRNVSGEHRRTLIVAYKGYEQYGERFFKLEAPGAPEAVHYLLGASDLS